MLLFVCFFFYLFCERNCLIIAFYGNTMHHQYNNIDHGSYKFLYFCLPHHICDFPSSLSFTFVIFFVAITLSFDIRIFISFGVVYFLFDTTKLFFRFKRFYITAYIAHSQDCLQHKSFFYL